MLNMKMMMISIVLCVLRMVLKGSESRFKELIILGRIENSKPQHRILRRVLET